MKLNVSFTPDLVALMRAEVAAGQKAVSTTMTQAGRAATVWMPLPSSGPTRQ